MAVVRTALGSAVGAGLLLCGCTIKVPPPQPPHPPQGPPARVPKGAANGKPAQAVKPGGGLGIWIWREADGKWHVLSTTKGPKHIFRGLIHGVRSPIRWYKPDRMELGDGIAPHSQGLVFKFETAGHVDGFQFVPDNHGCVKFHVTANERPQPDLIFIGPSGIHPPSDHFVACP